MKGYSVNVYDCAGQYRETKCATWTSALVTYDAERARYPDKVVAVFNYDRCDERFGGLTEDERAALDEVRPVMRDALMLATGGRR